MLLQDFAVDVHLVRQRCGRLLLINQLALALALALHLLEAQPAPLGIVPPEALVAAAVAARRGHARDAPEALSARIHLARRRLGGALLQGVDGALRGDAHARHLLLHAAQGRALPPSRGARVVAGKRQAQAVGLARDAGGVGDERLDVGLAHRAAAVGLEPLVRALLVVGVQARQHPHLVAVLVVHQADGTRDHRSLVAVGLHPRSGLRRRLRAALEAEHVGALLQHRRGDALARVRREHLVQLLIVEVVEVEWLPARGGKARGRVPRPRLRLALLLLLLPAGAHRAEQVPALHHPRAVRQLEAAVEPPPPAVRGRPAHGAAAALLH